VNSNIPLLVSLQDIDNLLRDFSEGEEANELRSLGFVLGKLEELKATREKVRSGVDPALLRAYDRLASVYKRRVVVPVVNGTCSGCFGALATARLQKAKSGDRTLFCEHCGRILFWL
jgi:predicted  nucleic acid-binding Zn-ribbon protein